MSTFDVRPALPRADLNRVLKDLADSVPRTRGVVLATNGLAQAAHGLERDEADHLTATASGLYSLAYTTGAQLGAGGVRQVVAELDGCLLSVSAAGNGTYLAVLTDAEVDAAVLGHRAAMVIKDINSRLSPVGADRA